MDMQHPAHMALLASSQGRGWRDIGAALVRIQPGRHFVPGGTAHRLGIHVGAAVNADCRVDGMRQRRVQSEGDIDIIPAGLDGEWEDDAACTVLRLTIGVPLLRRTAEGLGLDPDRAAIAPRLQLDDRGLRHIAWALKAELEGHRPADPLYAESLGDALALRLLALSGLERPAGQVLSRRQGERVLAFIEAHLDGELSLATLAGIAGLGPSHFKALFRRRFGMPVHQFVIRRRVERARHLLLGGDLPIAQVALEAGFAHQSHMAQAMKRLLGLSPSALRRLER